MGESEKYVQNYLDTILARAQKIEESRRASIHSTYFRNFYHFDKGDRVSMTLSSIALSDPKVRIEGVLANPEFALVDVKLSDGLEEWENQTIGLGVCTNLPNKDTFQSFTKVIAGNGAVAYYVPNDMGIDSRGKPTIDDSKLRLLPFLYTKVTVGGSRILDFTTDT